MDDEVTYAHLATMLVRAFYNDDYENFNKNASSWFTPFCEVAMDHGLFHMTKGDQANYTSVVQTPLTRYEMAQMLYNLLTATHALPEYDPSAIQASIADWNCIPEQYREAVLGVTAAGLISGVDSHGTFYGDGLMTRGQAAVVLTHLLSVK